VEQMTKRNRFEKATTQFVFAVLSMSGIAVCVPALIGPAAAGSCSTQTCATAKNDVDIYSGPGGQFKVIGMMPAAEMGAILEYHRDGWCKLRIVTDTVTVGWVAKDHLKNCPMDPQQEGRWATTKDEVDVYDSPVSPRHVIGSMIAFSRGRVLASHPDGWCKLQGVAAGYRDGWVAQDHLKERCEP